MEIIDEITLCINDGIQYHRRVITGMGGVNFDRGRLVYEESHPAAFDRRRFDDGDRRTTGGFAAASRLYRTKAVNYTRQRHETFWANHGKNENTK